MNVMNVYFTDEKTESLAFAERVLRERYAVPSPRFARTGSGKPRLVNAPLFFSLSHTHGRLFLAVAEEEIGLDAEWRGRRLPAAYLARLTPAERQEDFFRLWTAKEAYVKYSGGTLCAMLPSLRFEGGRLLRQGELLPASISFGEWEDTAVALCGAAPAALRFVRG